MYSYLISYNTCIRYKYDLSVGEAAELARRAIYHATFRDGASGGVASGTLSLSLTHTYDLSLCHFFTCLF